MAHEIVDEEFVLGTALFLKICELVGVAVNTASDEVDMVVGGGEFVFEELGVGLGVIVDIKCFFLDSEECGNGCLALVDLSNVTCVSSSLFILDGAFECCDHVSDGVEDTFN